MRRPAAKPSKVLARANADRKAGRLEAAETAFRQLTGSRDEAAEAWLGLGRIALARGLPAEAIPAFEHAIAVDPGHMLVLANLGVACRASGRFAEAARWLEAVVARGGREARLFRELGRAYLGLGQTENAAAAFRAGIELDPNDAELTAFLANALRDQGDAAAALALATRAAALDPASDLAAYAHASALIALGRHTEGIAEAEQLLARSPDYVDMRFNLSWAQLALGRWAEGWANYEYRLKVYPHLVAPPAGLPRWAGEPPDGGTLVVIAEQGLGDALQFGRFVAVLAARGHRVHLRVEPRMVALMRGFAGVAAVEAYGVDLPADASRWVPLLSLPGILGIDEAALGADVPYIRAEPARIARVRDWLGDGLLDRLVIGVQWRGNPAGSIDRGRSVPVEAMLRLAALPHVEVVALQRPPGLDELTALGGETRIRVAPHGLDRDGAFLDTAAYMTAFDLVVTCDTSIAHLAGAVGCPTFVLLKSTPDWRWMVGRDDSPWYPTMRLFRQDRAGDWEAPVARLIAAVEAMTEAMRAGEARSASGNAA